MSLLKQLYSKFPHSLRTSLLKPSQISPYSHVCAKRCSSKMADLTTDFSSVKPVVGVVQMTSTPDKEANLAMGTALIHRACKRGAQMVFLPEAFDVVGESREDTILAREQIDGPVIKQYSGIAKSLGVWLSLGGAHQKPADQQERRVLNTHVIIDSNGEIRGCYSKVHLFDVDIKGGVQLKESDFTVPGKEIGPPIDTPVGRVGMAICYDLRFPELSLALTQQGAEILTYPSAFTVPTGMAHWEPLLRSRAIENQCYVIAAAQVGRHHAKRNSYGHSMVVDPWGCIIAECTNQIDICVAEIDLEYLTKRRTEMPLCSHRRYDLYGHMDIKVKAKIDDRLEYQFGQYKVKSSGVFYKSALSFAFVNRKPVIPGHMLISPLRPVQRFADLTPAEVADLWQSAQVVSKVIEKQYNGTSLTMAIQDGPEAGQTVTHVHIHVLPRKGGDFEKNDDIYVELEKHDKDVKASLWRTDEDMAAESASLRPFFS